MNKSVYREIRSRLNFKFSVLKFTQQICLDALFLSGMAYLLNTEYQWFAFIPVALFMFRHFSILHEAVHNLSHPNSKINFLVGVVSGGFCLTPYLYWKGAHMKHHYWTGNLEQDPTFTILKSHSSFSSHQKRFLDFCWKQKIPVLATLQHLGFWAHFLQDFKDRKKSVGYWLNLLLPLALWSFIFWQASWVQSCILLIGVSTYMYLSEHMIIPQHVGLYSDSDPTMHLHPWEQMEITRTWKMSKWFEQFVALNMNYHTEHHLFPDLPWHQLEKAHQLVSDNAGSSLNIAHDDWMNVRRHLDFSEVIRPVAARRKNEAA